MTIETDDSLAFPCTELNSDGSPYATHLGMTLRDYFAGQALAGMSANPEFADHSWDITAKNAFDAADAMLAARAKSEPKT